MDKFSIGKLFLKETKHVQKIPKGRQEQFGVLKLLKIIFARLVLVVAGYELIDTTNAVTYLTMKDVDTSKEYKGITATDVVTEVTVA